MISDQDTQKMEATIRLAEEHSDDESTKVGCMIFSSDNRAAVGVNHWMEGVEKTPERLQRPEKYKYISHAEENAVLQAVSAGLNTKNSTAYINWFPCSTCFRLLVKVGVVRLVVIEKRMDHPSFKDDFQAVKSMAKDLGIRIDVYTPPA